MDKTYLDFFNYYMQQNVGENPIQSVDTYGVMLMLGYLIKDPQVSGRAKRYFRSVMDNWLKTKI